MIIAKPNEEAKATEQSKPFDNNPINDDTCVYLLNKRLPSSLPYEPIELKQNPNREGLY